MAHKVLPQVQQHRTTWEFVGKCKFSGCRRPSDQKFWVELLATSRVSQTGLGAHLGPEGRAVVTPRDWKMLQLQVHLLPGAPGRALARGLSSRKTHTCRQTDRQTDRHTHTHTGEGNRERGPLRVFRTYFSSRNRKGKIHFVKFLVRARD